MTKRSQLWGKGRVGRQRKRPAQKPSGGDELLVTRDKTNASTWDKGAQVIESDDTEGRQGPDRLWWIWVEIQLETLGEFLNMV